MTENEIFVQLSAYATDDEMLSSIDAKIKEWNASNVGIEAVRGVLKFMESHPDWDFGMPGPLVHYVETFYRRGYEQLLLESIRRRPTAHTIWMLNRIINGENDHNIKTLYLDLLTGAKNFIPSDPGLVAIIDDFLGMHRNN